jgi:hypothetical protein
MILDGELDTSIDTTLMDRTDALTACATRTEAIAATLASNFLQGVVGYHTINEETVAGLLWQIQANMETMSNLARVTPR